MRASKSVEMPGTANEQRTRALFPLSRRWRALRTGLAYLAYGAGGVVLSTLILPLQRHFTRDGARAEMRAQRIIRHGYRFFIWIMASLGLIHVRRIGCERLQAPGPLLIVANHPSLIDSALLGALLPEVDCIANTGWADNPFIRGAAAAAGYIRNDDGGAAVDEAVRRLRAGRRLLVFPEGTRSPERSLGSFQRGAAHIALRANCPFTPVVITVEPPSLMKGQKWYDVPERTMEIQIEVPSPLHLKTFLIGNETVSLAARRVTAGLREFFQKRLEERGTSGSPGN